MKLEVDSLVRSNQNKVVCRFLSNCGKKYVDQAKKPLI